MTRLKKAFDKLQDVCVVCGTPTDGRYLIGDKDYCSDDYTREKEKPIDLKKIRLTNEAKRLLVDITGDL
ncbi:hypothetical protein LCGC14_2675710 [marine sediment metagenome]|uniref:Uncharacterized protein n=1 Tax=marine sediment metagenome TaxID=412755 RepID=A0A0F9CEL4_9ZZZZ